MYIHSIQLFLAIFLFSSFLFLSTQVIAQQSSNAGGHNTTLPDGSSVSGTFGQIFIQRLAQSSISITEGVQQPLEVNTPLPVTLLYFKATSTSEGYVLTQWSTSAEINHASFTVERSRNGKDFTALHVLASSGDKLAPQSYEFLDTAPLKGISYYRLKQTDLDGSFMYAPMVAIQQFTSESAITTYPNPTSDYLAIRLEQTTTLPSTYMLYSSTGAVVGSGRLLEQTTQLSIEHLVPGTYLLKIQHTQQQAKTFQIVKK